jgi:hypothetical protein
MEKTFWLKNPNVLINNYHKFVPTSQMNRIEQLNAITRLCIYYIFLLLILNKNKMYLGLPIIVIIFVIIIYLIHDNDTKGKYNDYIKKKILITKDEKINKYKDILEAGYYDSEGKLKFGQKNDDINESAKDFVNYSYNELLEYENNARIKPTKENPFMNPIVTDFGKENIVLASNVNDDEIKQDIEEYFNVDLYRDLSDLYDIKNSQRVWYTIPTTALPNDQDEFAKWLYKTDNICKVNQGACLKYEDLRYKR